jgi:hypothetical protein
MIVLVRADWQVDENLVRGLYFRFECRLHELRNS